MEAEVKVVMSAHGRGEVFVNGQKIPGVQRVRFSAKIGSTNRLILDLKPSSIEVVGPVDLLSSIPAADEHGV